MLVRPVCPFLKNQVFGEKKNTGNTGVTGSPIQPQCAIQVCHQKPV